MREIPRMGMTSLWQIMISLQVLAGRMSHTSVHGLFASKCHRSEGVSGQCLVKVHDTYIYELFTGNNLLLPNVDLLIRELG